MNLEQIKNEYAVSKGYFSWENLFRSYKGNCSTNDFYHCINKHENEVMILAQKECLKRASERLISDVDKVYVTNENNIIK